MIVCSQSTPLTERRMVPRPYSKLTRLCETAAARGGNLTTFAAVAKALGLTPGRVTQIFGSSQDVNGIIIQPDTLGGLVRVFAADGVRCEIVWLYQSFNGFAAEVARANPVTAGPDGRSVPNVQTGDWRLTQDTILPDLVELHLDPPSAANEPPDSHYVNGTLLFGTAVCDYAPDGDEDPRAVSIALTKARLSIGSDQYQPLRGTVIGERVTSEHFMRVAGGVEITGPTEGDVLKGNPIRDDHLAVIAGTNASDEPFAVTVAANWGSFVVTDAGALAPRPGANAPQGNKAAILNALIYKHARKDELNRAILARATMRRRQEPPDQAS